MGLLDWFYGTPAKPPPPPPPRTVQRARTQGASGQLARAQTDAQCRLNQSPTPANGRLPCGLPVPTDPCDLKTFTVTENRTKTTLDAPWIGPSKTPPKERTHPARFEFAKGGTRTQNPYLSGTILEVVAGGPRDNKKTTLALAIATDHPFCKTRKHPIIRVTDPKGAVTLHEGKLNASLIVYRPARVSDTRGWAAAFWEIWAFSVRPAVYRIDAEVCGVRPRGGAVKSQHTAVRVYPDDQWELELTCPPLATASVKRSTNRGDQSVKWTSTAGLNLPGVNASVNRTSTTTPQGSNSSVNASLDNRWGDTRSTRTYTSSRENGQLVRQDFTAAYRDPKTGAGFALREGADRGGNWTPQWYESLAPSSEPLSTRFKMIVKRNGAKVDIIDQVVGIINAINNIVQTLQDIWKAIKSFKPKVGWDFSFDFQVLTGFFKATWGWKEHTNHQVFMGYALDVGIQVFKVEMKLAFGVDLTIKGYGFVLKAEGSIEALFKVKASFERKTPAAPEFSPKKIEGDSKAKLEVTCTVGSSRWVQITGGVESGFSCEGYVVKDAKGLGLDVQKIKFKGLKAKGRAVVIGWLDWTGEIKLMDEKQVGGPLRLPG